MLYRANHQLRLNRAAEHLESLKAELAEWLEENPIRLVPDFDLKSGKKLVRVEGVRQPPTRFAIIIGDVLHNLRAALDNLAYELAETGYGGPLPEAIAKTVEFPIFRKESDWLNRSAGPNRIARMRPGAQTIIEGLQPYKRGDESAASEDLLWILHKLSNIDKHRLPHLTLFIPSDIPFFTTDLAGLNGLQIFWGAIEEGAVIASYYPSTNAYTEVDMQNPPTFTIAFQQGPQLPVQDWPALTILTRTRNYIVQRVVDPLIRHLA
jgi:hypothetical protein